MLVEFVTERGGYTATATGQKFYHREPESHNFRLYDIAHQLAQVARYGGACKFPYSVAQHSVLMADYAMRDTGDPVLALDCLFHDASEAYLGDIKAPQKRDLPDYQELETATDYALRTAYAGIGVPAMQTSYCLTLDKRIVSDEKAQIMPDVAGWVCTYVPLGIKIHRWSFEKARRRFAQTATTLAETVIGVNAAHAILWER